MFSLSCLENPWLLESCFVFDVFKHFGLILIWTRFTHKFRLSLYIGHLTGKICRLLLKIASVQRLGTFAQPDWFFMIDVVYRMLQSVGRHLSYFISDQIPRTAWSSTAKFHKNFARHKFRLRLLSAAAASSIEANFLIKIRNKNEISRPPLYWRFAWFFRAEMP